MTTPIVHADLAVDGGYLHYAKIAEPTAGIPSRPGLKWYEIRSAQGKVDADVRTQAQSILATDPEFTTDDVGFVEIHLCGESFYFLLVCRWRNNNELWETAYTKDGQADFELMEGGATRATFCVWELGVVCHERQAWITYLKSSRDSAALAAYLDDRFTGEV